MSGDRFVVAGLAHVRSTWFREVARWSTVGSVPVEFVKCLSAEELRARLATGRPFSAALVDGRLPAVDRDLLALLEDRGTPALVVAEATRPVDWTALGAAAVLDAPFDRSALLDALGRCARPVGSVPDGRDLVRPTVALEGWRAPLVAVVGRSGAGASTVAIATAQALADDPRRGGQVVLADLAHHAHQALLHDARDVAPGLQELVEAHRAGAPSGEQVRALTHAVPTRGYQLLLGLRRPRDWVAIRSHAFAAALDGLRVATQVVVADVDSDVEGEADTGSFDVEDRNLLARRTLAEADLVVVVALPTTTGLHGLVHLLTALRGHGVGGGRQLVVVNRAPRRPRARAELAAAIAELVEVAAGAEEPYLGPVFLPDRRGVDALHRDVARLPAALTGPLAASIDAVLDRLADDPRPSTSDEDPTPIVPGSLGRWTEPEPDPSA